MDAIKPQENFTDAEIIEKILRGEIRLYELLIRRCNPFLYRIGRSWNYTHHDTEDLMQETYVSAFYSLRNFEKRSSFKTWITRIMFNNCYHKKQKRSFRNETLSEEPALEKALPASTSYKPTETMMFNKELGRVLENALSHIPEDYRLIFTLRELNGFSVAETASVAAISETNVKVRLNRAKHMLRSEIEKIYTPADIYEFNLVYCDRMVDRVLGELLKTGE